MTETVSLFSTCIGYSIVTMTAISVIVSSLSDRRLSILALMLCLGFISEVTTRQLKKFLSQPAGSLADN